ncbi:DM13 domain-containing protein [Deinococcus sp. SM5_A1]|uniref:DM13 domain-containing protein n=1 Tax=Deinococcus sp. SM5_A1 TaxID=3379094 RepID=UPI00385F57EA
MTNRIRTTALILTAALSAAAFAQTTTPKTDTTAPVTAPAMSDGMTKASMSGTFTALEAPTTGSVKLGKDAKGQYTLTISNLKTEPAPDLHVWLVPGGTVKDTPDLKKGKYADLGKIETTAKSKTFVLPKGIDPAEYRNVVLWCDEFSVVFAAAVLK